MLDLPSDWGALCALVFLLGLRHGVDADHLVAIDAMTRIGVQAGRRGARWCGVLFALGHGTVVVAIAVGMAGARMHWALPPWLDTVGAGISILLLFWLGIANLRALLATPTGVRFAPVAIKGRWLTPGTRPVAALGVGALFAISFDTVGQAALFGLAASKNGGIAPALVLGALFASGMALVDGANGWWVCGLLRRAGPSAVRVSRVLGWTIAAASLGVAALGAARLVWPAFDEGAGGLGPLQGIAVITVVAASAWLARRRLRRPVHAAA